MKEPKARDLAAPQGLDAVKTYSVYDVNNRLVEFYTAGVNAEDGDTCLVTYYGYLGASNRVEKTKESLASWDSAWEL